MAVALQRSGMTKLGLARLVGMSHQALAHWCSGKVAAQPDILAWVQDLTRHIEANPPPRWKPGQASRSGRWGARGENQNGQGATGRERPSHSVTPNVNTDEKHDLPPTKAR
jgi:transcriptional regulator with XRE-family HTH domain